MFQSSVTNDAKMTLQVLTPIEVANGRQNPISAGFQRISGL